MAEGDNSTVTRRNKDRINPNGHHEGKDWAEGAIIRWEPGQRRQACERHRESSRGRSNTKACCSAMRLAITTNATRGCSGLQLGAANRKRWLGIPTQRRSAVDACYGMTDQSDCVGRAMRESLCRLSVCDRSRWSLASTAEADTG